MLRSAGGQPVTTKAPNTLVLIIENQHASWDLMGNASPAVDLVHCAPRATLTVARNKSLKVEHTQYNKGD